MVVLCLRVVLVGLFGFDLLLLLFALGVVWLCLVVLNLGWCFDKMVI